MIDKTILFQGDSITDCKRNRFSKKSLGFGYCSMIADDLSEYPYSIINKGISGNTTTRLKKRWTKDTLAINPDILSLLIGINDTWRKFDKKEIITDQKFFSNYSYLLESIKNQNPNIQLIIMSPFLIPLKKEQEDWFEDLNPKIELIKTLATKHNAIYIPLQEKFNDILINGKSPNEITLDGVHLTDLGHRMLANIWLDNVLESIISK